MAGNRRPNLRFGLRVNACRSAMDRVPGGLMQGNIPGRWDRLGTLQSVQERAASGPLSLVLQDAPVQEKPVRGFFLISIYPCLHGHTIAVLCDTQMTRR